MRYVLAGMVVMAGFIYFFCPTDDTDKSFFNRSGMSLYTDHATGLQYLGIPLGGMTPRLDLEGNHMREGSGL